MVCDRLPCHPVVLYLQGTDVVAKLYAAHQEGKKNTGVDLEASSHQIFRLKILRFVMLQYPLVS